MKALFFPCTLDGHHRHTGSALIRARWVAKYWDGTEVYDGTQRLRGYDLYIFQKVYRSAIALNLINALAEARHVYTHMLAFDLCDPDFLDAQAKEQLLDVLPLFDFAVAPTAPLTQWLGQWLPAYTIADHFDPAALYYNRPALSATDGLRMVWIGYEGNFTAVTVEMQQAIYDAGLTCDVIKVAKPVAFKRFLRKLVEYDVLLNPRPNFGKYQYKSNNKSLIAWNAGLFVVETVADVATLLNPETRAARLALMRQHARMPPKLAARQWQQVVIQEGAWL